MLKDIEREANALRAVKDVTLARNRPNDPVSFLPSEDERSHSLMRDAIQNYLKLR